MLALLALLACADGTGGGGEARDLDRDGVPATGDCDDADGSVGAPAEWFEDADGDGWGGSESVLACEQPGGHVEGDGDCDDADGRRFPGNEERCDGRDNDCDAEVDEDATGATTWCPDEDGDGHGSAAGTYEACEPADPLDSTTCLDCDDTTGDIYPRSDGRGEDCDDGVDNDCDGHADKLDDECRDDPFP